MNKFINTVIKNPQNLILLLLSLAILTVGSFFMNFFLCILLVLLVNLIWIVPYIKNPNVCFFLDYKSALQEAVQTKSKSVKYEVIHEEGPSHDKTFTVAVSVAGIIYGKGTGSSKKEAEQEAAKEALSKNPNLSFEKNGTL